MLLITSFWLGGALRLDGNEGMTGSSVAVCMTKRLAQTLGLLLLLLSGALAQQPTIPPDAFNVASGSNPPPPPPPQAGNLTVGFDNVPPTTPAPTPAPAPTTSASAPSAGSAVPQPQSSGSSGISGGAIAGIVIGVVAGIAILALLALFLLRRRRNALGRAQDLEASRLNAAGNKPSEGLAQKPSDNYHKHLGSLNHKPSGLDWKDGDEIKSVAVGQSRNGPIPEGSTPETSQTQADSDFTTNIVQVMKDNTTVIIKKGPGGSIQISKIGAEAPASTGMPNSQASTVSAVSSGATMGSKGSGVSSSVDLPDLPWSDWQIKADDIIFATNDKGQPVKLGSGAYGTVFKATIDGVTECACKVFHDVHNQLQQADILREVAILKSCRDRNIVQFLGACIMDERIMLVTELMESGDLWHAMQDHKATGLLSWYQKGKQIAVEVARGLHFLHRHKIIHFDLKSPNVLLSNALTAKVSDVGFSRILSSKGLSRSAQAFTFAWAAPEILMGGQASDKVDIFSYGVLLWEIVTGERPQRGQLRDCLVPDECPSEVESLIQKCLSYEPTDRPTCKEIVEVLTRLEGSHSILGTSLTSSTPLSAPESAPLSGPLSGLSDDQA